MNKYVFCLIMFLLVFVLAGCSNNNDERGERKTVDEWSLEYALDYLGEGRFILLETYHNQTYYENGEEKVFKDVDYYVVNYTFVFNEIIDDDIYKREVAIYFGWTKEKTLRRSFDDFFGGNTFYYEDELAYDIDIVEVE